MSYITLHYRLKSGASSTLRRLAPNVNFVWNYCKETSDKAYRYHKKSLTGFDLSNLTSGVSKELNLSSTTIQAVCEEYGLRKSKLISDYVKGKAKKTKLRWRSHKTSLGWVPFKGNSISFKSGNFIYCKKNYKFFDSKYKNVDLTNIKFKSGSFSQDSRGRWFINLVIEVDDVHSCLNINNAVGVDLGKKELITTSDGEAFENPKFFYVSAKRLAMAQRAKKKRLVAKLHDKIKNQRKDYINKVTTSILKEYDLIVVGNLHLGASKSTLDAAFGQVKSCFKNKAIRLGKTVLLVNEAWTTQQCSCCKQHTGPRGLMGLSVREWICSSCGSRHNRDINAATNILRLGHQTL